MEQVFHKVYDGQIIKSDSATGQLVVRFAKYNDKDKHKDIFESGSLKSEREKVPFEPYNHQPGRPLGVGIVYDAGDDVLWDGNLDMEDAEAAAMFRHIQAMGDSQQYSFHGGFSPRDVTRNQDGGRTFRKATVLRVGAVDSGAGNTTGTVFAKENGIEEEVEVDETPTDEEGAEASEDTELMASRAFCLTLGSLLVN